MRYSDLTINIDFKQSNNNLQNIILPNRLRQTFKYNKK